MALETLGFDVQTFKSDRNEASERINLSLESALPSLGRSRNGNHPLHLKLLRLALKGTMVLKTDQRWAFFDALLRPKPYTLAREINAFLDRSQWSKVYLISHSAGGIAATKISKNPKVAGIFCFGYPFKRPDRPPENYRTKHLFNVAKPLFIFQGIFDDYGAPSPHIESMLPLHGQVIGLGCDHDYDDISDDEFQNLIDIILKTMVYDN